MLPIVFFIARDLTHINYVVCNALLHCLLPQVSYSILQMVSPVTHAVGNCVKRVVVIVSSVIFFQTPVSPINTLGKSNNCIKLPNKPCSPFPPNPRPAPHPLPLISDSISNVLKLNTGLRVQELDWLLLECSFTQEQSE